MHGGAHFLYFCNLCAHYCCNHLFTLYVSVCACLPFYIKPTHLGPFSALTKTWISCLRNIVAHSAEVFPYELLGQVDLPTTHTHRPIDFRQSWLRLICLVIQFLVRQRKLTITPRGDTYFLIGSLLRLKWL